MPMQPRPIADTSGPLGPSVRRFTALGYSSRAALAASAKGGTSGFPPNLPNLLTVLRIMLVPALVVALLGNTPAGDVLAAVVFALASLTDFVDGYLARARDSVTTFGERMGP